MRAADETGLPLLFQSIALALNHQGVTVVQEAIEDGGWHRGAARREQVEHLCEPPRCVFASWGGVAEIVSLRTFIEDDGARLTQLLSRLRAQGMSTLRFPEVLPAEISTEFMEMLGFRPAGTHRLYAAKARSE